MARSFSPRHLRVYQRPTIAIVADYAIAAAFIVCGSIIAVLGFDMALMGMDPDTFIQWAGDDRQWSLMWMLGAVAGFVFVVVGFHLASNTKHTEAF